MESSDIITMLIILSFVEHRSTPNLPTSLWASRVSVPHFVGRGGDVTAVPHAILNSNLGSKWRRTLHSHKSREEAKTTVVWKNQDANACRTCVKSSWGPLFYLKSRQPLSAAAADCEAGRLFASDLER